MKGGDLAVDRQHAAKAIGNRRGLGKLRHVELKWLCLCPGRREGGPRETEDRLGQRERGQPPDEAEEQGGGWRIAQEGWSGVRGVVRREPALGPRRKGGVHLRCVFVLLACEGLREVR